MSAGTMLPDGCFVEYGYGTISLQGNDMAAISKITRYDVQGRDSPSSAIFVLA